MKEKTKREISLTYAQTILLANLKENPSLKDSECFEIFRKSYNYMYNSINDSTDYKDLSNRFSDKTHSIYNY